MLPVERSIVHNKGSVNIVTSGGCPSLCKNPRNAIYIRSSYKTRSYFGFSSSRYLINLWTSGEPSCKSTRILVAFTNMLMASMGPNLPCRLTICFLFGLLSTFQ
uniref:Uncharacterized protein n=1 Tax=Cacopsylla melanoneura TaxID=428564 RepID=A0A8D9ANP3_9HEMI